MNEERCVLLAEKIGGILREGLKLSDDMLHYIDSTFCKGEISFALTSSQLEAIIADESDCELDSLMSLIFFPDEPIQVRLEEFLENEDFHKTDEDKVAMELIARSPEIILYFPDKRGIVKVPMSESNAGQFVSRLNISKKTDKRLIVAINRHAGEDWRNLLKVKLRNARFAFSENKILFLCDFFEKADSAEIGNLLDFISGFFDELGDDRDIFQALETKKNFYFQNLQQQIRLEDQMKKNTMETLISQGLRIPYIDKADTLNKIAMIDFIGFKVFGRSTVSEYLMGEPDMRIYGQQDIENMIRMLC
jgi:hypothetical protein